MHNKNMINTKKLNFNLTKLFTEKIILLKYIAVFFLLLSSFSLAAKENQIILNGSHYDIEKAEAVLFTKNGRTQLLIALNNYTNNIQITIVAQIKENEIFSKQRYDTRYNKISVTVKSKEGRFAIMPLILFSEELSQMEIKKVSVKDKSGNITYKHIRARPAWQKMTRKERLAKGAGIRKNLSMIGQFFSLNLNPVKNSTENKVIVSFSGIGEEKNSARNKAKNKKVKFSSTGIPINIKFIKK